MLLPPLCMQWRRIGHHRIDPVNLVWLFRMAPDLYTLVGRRQRIGRMLRLVCFGSPPSCQRRCRHPTRASDGSPHTSAAAAKQVSQPRLARGIFMISTRCQVNKPPPPLSGTFSGCMALWKRRESVPADISSLTVDACALSVGSQPLPFVWSRHSPGRHIQLCRSSVGPPRNGGTTQSLSQPMKLSVSTKNCGFDPEVQVTASVESSTYTCTYLMSSGGRMLN
jgi:hypothetical protein